MDSKDLPKMLTPKIVMQFLELPQDQVYRLFNSKGFPSRRINAKHYITKPDFLKWYGIKDFQE